MVWIKAKERTLRRTSTELALYHAGEQLNATEPACTQMFARAHACMCVWTVRHKLRPAIECCNLFEIEISQELQIKNPISIFNNYCSSRSIDRNEPTWVWSKHESIWPPVLVQISYLMLWVWKESKQKWLVLCAFFKDESFSIMDSSLKCGSTCLIKKRMFAS